MIATVLVHPVIFAICTLGFLALGAAACFVVDLASSNAYIAPTRDRVEVRRLSGPIAK